MEALYTDSRIKRCVIVTGMSGGGKSSALNVFEDKGFYVIDNLPPTLLPQLLDVLSSHQAAVSCGVAAVVDVRSKDLLCDLDNVVARVREKVEKLDIFFVDATDECLIKRFETTRRRHPLASDTSILGGIERERKMLKQIHDSADIVIDTSGLNPPEFKQKLLDVLGVASEKLSVIMSSFGFKYGIPQDSDYVLDVRFLPNPNYVEELHCLTGKEAKIKQYLEGFKELSEFTARAKAMLEFVASVYSATGKKQLHIAVGCTGGHHRSVAVTEMLAEYLQKCGNSVVVSHRDIDKENSW